MRLKKVIAVSGVEGCQLIDRITDSLHEKNWRRLRKNSKGLQKFGNKYVKRVDNCHNLDADEIILKLTEAGKYGEEAAKQRSPEILSKFTENINEAASIMTNVEEEVRRCL